MTVDTSIQKKDLLDYAGKTHKQLSVSELVEQALARKEGQLAANGALTVQTGAFTGRSPLDKYIVRDMPYAAYIDWGQMNQPMSPAAFAQLRKRLQSHIEQKELYVFEGYAGADEAYRLPVRVLTEHAWQSLFVKQLFIDSPTGHRADDHPFTVACIPSFQADPVLDRTRSKTVIAISFAERLIIIGGTHYAGEMKKSIFSVLNYLLIDQDVLPMHCSANIGTKGDVALFFGLSGTGKTTLSADPKRMLIGDDEHGWSSKGVFNFEGGCYAKCIGLQREKEPQIWEAIRFGSVLENVVLKTDRHPAYDDASLTENTRAAYSLDMVPQAVQPSLGGHPQVIFFLTADAFGVLPPISRLTPEQAMYHFLAGYTSKLAGTERGVTQPEATFSACFGSPFLPRPARIYADLLGQKLKQYKVPVYLVNTGWTGGEYGSGHRMPLAYTRAMINAAIEGQLEQVEYEENTDFQLQIPQTCPGVPNHLLQPINTWQNPKQYDQAAAKLKALFQKHMALF